jgi:GNAT superfamily N-acetyltransferase
MDSIAVEILKTITVLNDLALDAQADGRRIVSRLMQEWTDGTNRFDQPGERLYVAIHLGQLRGVCGLNQDPFAGNPKIGRVRRLYVASGSRRRGVGSAILRRLIDDARADFLALHLRTHDRAACAFYESMRFKPVAGDPNCTHQFPLSLVGTVAVCRDHRRDADAT